MDSFPSVRAAINYLDRDCLAGLGGKPEFHSADRANFTFHAADMAIQDARPLRHQLSLDRQGFILVDHESAVPDFLNIDADHRLYHSEIERLIKDLTGAAAVSVLPTLLLRAKPNVRKKLRTVTSGPAHFAHCDYSATFASHLVRTVYFPDRQLDPDRRTVGFNIWRVITPPPQDIPLAMCDVRSISPADYVLADAVIDTPKACDTLHQSTQARDTRFESLLLLHNPEHRWHYFSNMTPDEVLIFKSHDSQPSCAQRVPHTAFRDLTSPPGIPSRMSIEARAFAYF
jgi:hypothetical protein